jgi:riboflavin synthase
MFSGIIEQLGRVSGADKRPDFVTITIDLGKIGAEVSPGDSVSVNGVCLTATVCKGGNVSFDIMHETLEKTDLGDLSVGDGVNIERSLRLGDRIDGHIVLGHVDGVATISEQVKDGDNCVMTFTAPPSLTNQMVHKGSVTVDGTSLTLTAVYDDSFSIAFIPYTLEHTVFATKKVGDRVNIEVDYIGKWIAKHLHHLQTQTS